MSWKASRQATLHCLTGCAIGEVLGMIIGTALAWSNHATVVLAVCLAFVFGYALTIKSLRGHGMKPKDMLKIALAADTVSVLTMELVDNSVMLVIPGAMEAGLDSTLFWSSLVLALFVAFWAAVPVNHFLIKRGKGHAVVHAHH